FSNLNLFPAAQGILDIIDNFDRPGKAYADGLYAEADAYAYAFKNKPGKRVPKAGAVAEAGVGRAGVQWSIFSAEARGPNAAASAEANVLKAKAMARAEIGSVSGAAGPVAVKLGLGIDTGVTLGPTKLECKILGFGVTVGSTFEISFFNCGLEINFL
ncbi:hypothetical protein C0J45_4428, partial [Silurus meridionalis]